MLHPAETDPLLEWVEPKAEENAWLRVLSVTQLMYQCPPVTSGHLFTGSPARLQMPACCCIKPRGCFLLLRRALGCGLCLYDRKMYTLLFLVPWVYPRLEGASVPTPAGSWEPWWGEKRERNHHLQIIHWAFFHSFYSACTFVCVAWRACCPGAELHSLPLFLPPVSLFVYVRLESCIHEDASVILTEQHTQSRQEAWHHQFPCSSVCKISTLSFPNLEERNTYVSIKFG